MINNLRKYYRYFKSDKRIKGGKSGICPLCEESKKLILSHITPRWAYYWAKQEDRGRIIGNYESLGVRIVEQDGSKHYLLCSTCDQHLGEAENYIKLLMHSSDEERKKLGITTIGDTFYGLNFELIQRFMFGLTLKAHYATSAPFHKILLKNQQLTDIQNRIKFPIKEDNDYPIIAMRFISEIAPEIDPKAIMIPMHQKNEQNEELISYLLGGWEWVIFFNKNKWINEKMILEMKLSTEGTMNVPVGDIIDQRFINKGKPLNRRERRKLKKENKQK